MVGLDAAGKTTILYKLKLGEVVTTIPTIVLPVSAIVASQTAAQVASIGTGLRRGGAASVAARGVCALSMRIHQTSGLRSTAPQVYMQLRAKEELHRMLGEDELRDAVLLVFANKQDLPNAMSVPEITDKLMLYSIRDGLFEGLDWLSTTLASKTYNRLIGDGGASLAGPPGRGDEGGFHRSWICKPCESLLNASAVISALLFLFVHATSPPPASDALSLSPKGGPPAIALVRQMGKESAAALKSARATSYDA
ncbi:hypothetical protein ACSSS7_005518 [Eimeria intestinalis]